MVSLIFIVIGLGVKGESAKSDRKFAGYSAIQPPVVSDVIGSVS